MIMQMMLISFRLLLLLTFVASTATEAAGSQSQVSRQKYVIELYLITCICSFIGVRAVNFGGKAFFPENNYMYNV